MTDASQYGEASFIAAHFAGRPGTFLDIGAFDGKSFSNTHHLAHAGWTGVCVEPSPAAFLYLAETYKDNQAVKLVNAALSYRRGLFPFSLNSSGPANADMLSTFISEHKAKWIGYPFREIFIPSITWGDLLEGMLMGDVSKRCLL